MNTISIKNDRVAWAVAGLALVLHGLFAGRYDVFRDELYFIVCGRHPAFGYADQPPVVPLLAAIFYAMGHSVWMLRLPATLAAGALAWLAARFARTLGGDSFAAAFAGIAVTIAPMLMGIVAIFNTTVFDPLAWTLIAYLLVRATQGDQKALLWAGLVAGLDFETKYSLVFWGAALAAGLIATPERKVLTDKKLWIGLGIAALIGLPSLIWQALNHWPFLELAAAARAKNADTPPVAFLLNQVLVMNPLLAPVWIAGIVGPFVIAALKPARFIAIAFVVCLALIMATHGKDYYTAATYPVVFILGAVTWAHWARTALARAGIAVWGGLAAALSAAVAPMALPVLSVPALRSYMAHSPLTPQKQEKSFEGTLLPQVFADQLGWHDYTNQVGAAWQKIPAAERARTSIKVENYGEAAALDVYGAPFGLPPALSGHNQYYLWGLRGQYPVNLLVVQNNPDRLAPYCRHVEILGTTFSPDAMSYENGKTIAWCQGLTVDPVKLWPELKNFS